MKECKTRTPEQGNKRRQAAFATGLGLALLWMGPVLAAAHPMGIGLGPEQAIVCKPEPGPGAIPPPPKHRGGPEKPGNPLESVLELPKDAQKVTLQRPLLYFSKGLFYTRMDERYAVIPPPPGALVPSLPDGYTTITVGPETFFVLEGTFFRQIPDRGYEVVPSPVEPVHMPPPPPPMPPSMANFEPAEMVSILVHGTNNKTSQVVLRRDGHRWIGPKGEVFDRLPTEQQLAMTSLETTP